MEFQLDWKETRKQRDLSEWVFRCIKWLVLLKYIKDQTQTEWMKTVITCVFFTTLEVQTVKLWGSHTPQSLNKTQENI